MEPIQHSETSAFSKNKMPGEYPKEILSSLQHGESLKSRSFFLLVKMIKKYILSRLGNILHSLATRGQKILLYRFEHVFPAQNTSVVSFLSSRI